MPEDPLRDHLDYFQELGVDGVHPEPLWRARAEGASMAGSKDPAPRTKAPAPRADVIPIEAVRSEAVRGPGSSHPGDTLAIIKAEIGPDCTRCKLHTLGRSQVVFGVGNPDADLMFVGEAPGADEDIKGEPFVGRAGQLLTKIIEAINLRREDVYIANVIKCRPPQNRNPEPDEVEQCEPFLFRQIDAIKPKVIVALGKFAAQCLLKTTEPITRIRGREYRYRDAILIPTYHPAYLLRNPSSKREVWEDMKRVRELLGGAPSRA
jgi:uracil-DNA glycosylase